MGSGKSRLGRILSKKLKREFIDIDREIESRAGLTIPEIFELYGEPKFRESEQKISLEYLATFTGIISTGGGAPANPDIMQAIKEKSISVWLKTDPEILYKRIKGNKNRPLLKTPDAQEKLKELNAVRDPIYSQADIHVDTSHQSIGKNVSAIIEALKQLEGGAHDP